MPRYRLRQFGLIALLVGVQTGCTPTHGGDHATKAPASLVTADNNASVDSSATDQPDLTKPFVFGDQTNESWLAPLNFARQLARSAGGTWVVFAPKPLDDVKFNAKNQFGGATSVQGVLESLRKAGTPVAWDTGNSAMLLDYAPAADLMRIRKQPPIETVGLLIRAENVPAMLRAVEEVWQIKIDADPSLIAQRNSFEASLRKLAADDESDSTSIFSQLMAGSGLFGGRGQQAEQQDKPTSALEFTAVERLSLDALMRRLAGSLGGEANQLGSSNWRLTRLTDPPKIAAEVNRLKALIDQETSALTAESSSYASRMSGDSDSGEDAGDASAMTPIPTVGEEAQAAFDTLGMLGQPAMPTLTGYLDAGKPVLATASMRTLDIMGTPEAHAALVAFARQLQAPPKDRAGQGFRPLLQTEVIRALGRNSDSGTRQLLTEIALGEQASPQARTAARMALVKTGELAPFESGANASTSSSTSGRELKPGEMEFVLREPPAGSGLQPMRAEVKRNAVIPLAITKSADGDDWAVFVSGRLGDPNDLWLARGHAGKWAEFLFTGHVFTRSQEYNQQGQPKPGACKISVIGDQVLIIPPNANVEAELARLQKAMMNPKMGQTERGKLIRMLSQTSGQVSNTLDKPISLSLAELRKDSDHDGLPDVVETRLGTDPQKADTDGDGIPDGRDANPLVGPNPKPGDRAQLLQLIFTALFGGDDSPDPIVVLLDREDWQEFYGACGRVLCMTPDDYLRRVQHLGAMRVLQFGGPRDAGATILQKDGPCLFTDTHTRAEVHFWQWGQSQGLQGQAYGMGAYMRMMTGGGGPQPTDYIAQFDRKGAWKLTSLKPWRFDTSDRAMVTMMGARARAMAVGMMAGD